MAAAAAAAAAAIPAPAPALCANPACALAVTEVAALRLLGAIAIQRGLPAGQPCWVARSMGAYTNARVRCPRGGAPGARNDAVCTGGCATCTAPAACAHAPACSGGCALCAAPRTCDTCHALGCAQCVAENREPSDALHVGNLAVAAVAASLAGDDNAAHALMALGLALEAPRRCDACPRVE